MTLATQESTLEPLLEGPFSGRLDFTALIRQSFVLAAAEGWREIIISDPDFADWPLGERAVIDSLNSWAGGGRKLIMLANKYTEVQRHHARFVSWRQTWGHLLDCRASTAGASNLMPSALWSAGWMFERVDRDLCVGVAGSDVNRRVALREDLNARLIKSSPAFSSMTLGL